MNPKTGRGRVIVYWGAAGILLAALLFGIYFTVCFGDAEKNGVDVLFLGDSVLAQERGNTSIAVQVAEQSDCQVVNCAVGGTMLSAGIAGSETEFQDMKNTLCMVALTGSISNGDFGAQKATVATEYILSYLPAAMATLESVALEETRVLVFNHGVNDYHRAVTLDNPEDPLDICTFGGAMRKVLSDLREHYPQLRILYVTPPYAWYDNGMVSCEEKDYGQGSLENYVNLAMEICEEYQVEVVDIFHGLYDLEQPDAAGIYTLDGLHPNEKGRTLIAQEISRAIDLE